MWKRRRQRRATCSAGDKNKHGSSSQYTQRGDQHRRPHDRYRTVVGTTRTGNSRLAVDHYGHGIPLGACRLRVVSTWIDAFASSHLLNDQPGDPDGVLHSRMSHRHGERSNVCAHEQNALRQNWFTVHFYKRIVDITRMVRLGCGSSRERLERRVSNST